MVVSIYRQGQGQAQTPGSLLRLGIVGLGSAGTYTARGLVSYPLARIAAAADPRRELRERFAQDFECADYPDIETLCQDSAVDAVYIATPHQFHREHALTAAAHGKHVIVEKPIALTLADCDAMIEAADRHGVKLIVGHTHAFDPAILTMGQMLRSGELGRLGMILSFNYTNFLYRPRRPEELDTSKGGGILFNQVPHQVDSLRFLGGGKLRSVRAMTGVWDPERPTEGSCMAFLEFENGAAATLVYSGYDHFDSDELHFWLAEFGQPKRAGHGSARRALKEVVGGAQEAALRTARYGYGNSWSVAAGEGEVHQSHFGVTLVSCEKGDLRPTADGIAVYGDDGVREVPVRPGLGTAARGEVIDELRAAIYDGRPLIHDGRWAKATLEVTLAIQRSARERQEVFLEHQTEVPIACS